MDKYTTEKQLEKTLEDALKIGQWRWVHFTHAKIGSPLPNGTQKWVTPFRGDAGFPDYYIIKPGHGQHLIELKTMQGKLSKGQKGWKKDFEAERISYHIIKPNNIQEFIETIIFKKN